MARAGFCLQSPMFGYKLYLHHLIQQTLDKNFTPFKRVKYISRDINKEKAQDANN